MKYPHTIHEVERRERIFHAALNSVPAEDAQSTAKVWELLKASAPVAVTVPYLDVREEGGTLLTWKQGRRHLDVEIAADGAMDFFYWNQDTDESWDIEVAPRAPLPEVILCALGGFRVIV